GIRDYKVTGVQTCALPISGQHVRNDQARFEASLLVLVASRLESKPLEHVSQERLMMFGFGNIFLHDDPDILRVDLFYINGNERRSEERRVGKECRYRR